MKIKVRSIVKCILCLFFAVCILFPNDIFNLKKILFFLLILLNYKAISYGASRKRIIIYFGLFFPLLIIIWSIVLSQEFVTPFFRGVCAFFILLYYIIDYYDIDYEKIFFSLVPIIAIITIGICLLDTLGVVGVYQPSIIREFIYDHEIGIMGLDGVFKYKVFLKTSPLIAIYLFYCFENKRTAGFIMSIMSLALSGARANIAFTFLVFTIYYFILYRNKGIIHTIIKGILICIIVGYIALNLQDLFRQFNYLFIENSRESDLTRIGHYFGLKEFWDQHPLKMIFGSGLGSSFYSYGVNSYVNSIELPYLDLYRQIGLIPFIAFCTFIIYPLIKIKNYAWVKAGYCTYLLIAATNPLLFNSTAYIVYIFIYYYYYKERQELLRGDALDE